MWNLQRAMTYGATAQDLLLADSQQPQTPSIKGEKWIFLARIDYSLKQIYFQQKLIISVRILLLLLLYAVVSNIICDQCQCQ